MTKTCTISRRDMLKTILAMPPILMFAPEGLFAGGETIEPLFPPKLIPLGQKIRLAQVGVFNRGNADLREFAKDTARVEFKAFADVLFTSSDPGMPGFPGIPCYRDYRQMLEEMHDQIDAVIVATPDHSHFPVLMHAMLLGKHVFSEKPLAQNVYECRLLEKTAKACGVVTQMGNQGHSTAGTIQFGQWVQAGLIKNVKRIDAWMTKGRRWHGWTMTKYPEAIPPIGYDWDQWLGRRPFRPYSDKLVDGNWRCWYDFGNGCMGDWGAHVLDAYHHYLKLGQPYEITTKLIGPSDLYYPQGSVITFKFKAREDMPPLELNWYDGKDNNPEPPTGYAGQMGSVGSIAYLDKGVVTGVSHGEDYHFALNEKLQAMEKAGQLPKPKKGLSSHSKNFLNACQGIEPANSPFVGIGAPLSEMLCLGCIGQRFGGTLKYDADTMTITNHPEANAMLKGPAIRENWDAYDKNKPVKSRVSQIKKPDQVEWEELFDKSLSKLENPYDWGNAEYNDGIVSLTTNKEKGKWFLMTRKEYVNFILEGEVKMPVGKGNSGFMFRCQKKKNKVWGYQAEVDTAKRMWSGAFFDEARRQYFISPNRDHAVTEEEKNASIAAFLERAGECFKQGEWNKYRIVCMGSHIQIFVNDVLTTDVHDEMDTAGYIGIQHHGEMGLTYQFRNLKIKDLGAGGEVCYPHRENAAVAPVASRMEGDIYEAEDAKLVVCKKAADHKGYQGTGYADLGEMGSSVEWDNVLADNNDPYVLTFRYSSVDDCPCELIVNGQKAGTIPFKSTKKYTSWKTVNVKADLKKGGNFIKVIADGKGPMLDAIAVNKSN